MQSLKQGAININDANKKQSGQALIIQAYANSVKEQPKVDFGGQDHLKIYEKQINDKLATAQVHADNYLNVIQPQIIQNITNIGNYYALHNAVPSTLPEGSTEEQWIEVLTALQVQADEYRMDADGIVIILRTLRDDLTIDTASFSATVNDLNVVVNGDNGILAADAKQLSDIQGKIDGAIGAIVASGLGIVGGVVLICVGAFATCVTGPAATSCVIGGITLVVAGVGGEIAAGITLKNLNDQKANIISEEAKLTEEVKSATAISSGYQGLLSQVKNAVDAASAMENAWLFLSNDLKSMVNDLRNGIKKSGDIRKIFLTAADTEVKVVIQDIETIKGQMAGVRCIVAMPGQTVGEAIMDAVKKAVA